MREIKGGPRTQSIPVVVLTSSREDRDLVESYGLGVNPVGFEKFVEAVQHRPLLGVLNEPRPR